MILLYPVVDPLLLLCETSGGTTQVTIDCQVNRPLSGTFCSFDGGHQHKCESEVYYVIKSKTLKKCLLSLFGFMATGQWPMIINVQSGLSAGNHSVVITARDILGLTAETTLSYLLEEEEQARQNRMYSHNSADCYAHKVVSYDITIIIL